MRKVAFLDVNGTLLDDWKPGYEALVYVLEHFGKKRIPIHEYIREVGADGDYHGLYKRRGITASHDEVHKIFMPVYHQHAGEIRVMTGAHELIEALRTHCYEVHIVTAARRDFIEPILQTTGLSKHCDGTHYHVHNKSAQVKAILNGSEYDRAQCAMVGDLPADIIHAKRAGIRGVGFRNPDAPPDLFRDTELDFLAFDHTGTADYFCD